MHAACYLKTLNNTSIDPKQLQHDSLRPILYSQKTISWYALITFTPRANCFINEFLSALTSLFVRPHSSPVSRATKTSHRVQGAAKTRARGGQDPDTEPGHRAQPPSPATKDKRTRPGHRAHRGQEEDKAWTQSPATEFRGATNEISDVPQSCQRSDMASCRISQILLPVPKHAAHFSTSISNCKSECLIDSEDSCLGIRLIQLKNNTVKLRRVCGPFGSEKPTGSRQADEQFVAFTLAFTQRNSCNVSACIHLACIAEAQCRKTTCAKWHKLSCVCKPRGTEPVQIARHPPGPTVPPTNELPEAVAPDAAAVAPAVQNLSTCHASAQIS